MTYLSDLKKLARAATPGPWELDKSRRVLGQAFDGSWRSICDQVRGGSPEAADANAALIAACSPERILQLVAVIEAARAAIPMLEACADDARKNSELDRVVDDFDAALAKLERSDGQPTVLDPNRSSQPKP